MSCVRRLIQALGIDKPLVLAPMGFVSGGALAAEVSQSSGLGLIGATSCADTIGRSASPAARFAMRLPWHGKEDELRQALAPEAANYRAAAERGDVDTAVIFAGEAVDLIDEVLPAHELVKRICG